MAFTPISGVLATVSVGLNTYAFSKWSFHASCKTPDVTNFTSLGYRTILTGIIEGQIEVSGPYNAGGEGWTVGNAYAIVVSWNGSITLGFTGILTDLKGDQDVEDAGKISLTFKSTGAFTPSIV